MNVLVTVLFSAVLAPGLLSAEPLYTREGKDPAFAAVLEDGNIKAGERFSKGPVHGSRIKVNHKLLEKQAGKAGPIPKDISLHTQASGGIHRRDFGNWTRWYQEDGNTQIFRLFKGEQSARHEMGEAAGRPGRVEVFSGGLKAAPGAWREWEGTYTFVEPVGACIFQLFHDGNDAQGKAILWPFHIDMSSKGDVRFTRRRSGPGMERDILIAENMAGKSLSIKVRANGRDYEVYQKSPLVDAPWKLVAKGSHTPAETGTISFRWGMYCGSKKGRSVEKDALLFVTGVTIR